MSQWNVGNGSWGTAANWIGGVPDSSTATATFDAFALGAGGNVALVSIASADTPITLNRLEIFSSEASGRFTIRPALANTGQVQLEFGSAFGLPAVIDIDSNGAGGLSEISTGSTGLVVRLSVDTFVQTRNSDSTFRITAPITGTGGLTKVGTGTLILSSTTNDFSGGLTLDGGSVRALVAASAGSGPIIFSGGTLVYTANTTVQNRMFVAPSSNGGGFLFAAASQTLTLDLPELTMLDPAGRLRLGSNSDNGTIVLAIDSFNYTPGASIVLNGATTRFANDFNAQNAFRFSGTGELEIFGNATLDTRGLQTFVSNLDMSGGIITSGTGALLLTAQIATSQLMTGTLQGTANADTINFELNGFFVLSLANLIISNWTEGTDSLSIAGTALNDVITGSPVGDTINGKGGNDLLNGGPGADTINGGTGDDSISGSAGNDIIDGFTGDDIIDGGDDNDQITGSGGIDTITGGNGNDTINGGTGADAIDGGPGADNLGGAGGSDEIHGGSGDDTISGGLGPDTIFGDDDNDTIHGNDSSDTILGGNGNDTIFGDLQNDTIDGEAGDDHISGGAGKDTSTGGGGADTFHFNINDFAGLRGGTADRVTDFSQAEGDKLDLSAIDAAIGPGQAGDQAFSFIGAAAFGGNPGELHYVQEAGSTYVEGDRDGDMVADFALRLDGLITLVAADFIL